jgi:hypothetical protein
VLLRASAGHGDDDRALARGLAALAGVVGIDPTLAERLSALPATPAAGERLETLALLLTAYEELAGRASSSARELRQALAGVPIAPRRRTRAPTRGVTPTQR